MPHGKTPFIEVSTENHSIRSRRVHSFNPSEHLDQVSSHPVPWRSFFRSSRGWVHRFDVVISGIVAIDEYVCMYVRTCMHRGDFTLENDSD